jgi:hypothetical protein
MCKNTHRTCRIDVPASMKRPVKRAIKEGTMKHMFDVVCAFVIGAAVLFGMGLLLQVGSTALELVALR